MDSSESLEMYLEAILKLEEKNKVVRSVDIAKFLGVTKPSVNRGMNNLKNAGCINQEPYGDISFTKKGREEANKIYQLHHIITDFIVKTLDLDIAVAEADACRIEHVISAETAVAIKEYLKKR